MTSLRLAVVLSHPTQYYAPWFRQLAIQPGVELRVFYLWEFGVKATRDPHFRTTFTWDVDLLSGYDSEFVPNKSRSPGAENFWGFNNPQLLARLSAWRPNAILLFGYKFATHLRLVAWARLHGVPLVFRGDSHFLGRGKPHWSRAWPLRFLYRQFSALTYVGAANHAYFRALGVPPRKLFFAPHAIDETLFNRTNLVHAAAAVALRAQLGLSARTRVLLFAGKLVPAKQPRELLEAFLAVKTPDAALVFVGDGEELSILKNSARTARSEAVHFLPFANQSEMPARYLLANVFVLPSRGWYETWGLAVNEAMQMGLPCLVSDRVGCQPDLVTDEETGWVFRAEDPAHLREKLALALRTDLTAYRPRVAARISRYSYAAATAGLLHALENLAPARLRNVVP